MEARFAGYGPQGDFCGTSLDARRMSTSTRACYHFAARKPKSSARKVSARSFIGGAAVASLVVGCAWTVYANILAASPYPQLGDAGFDFPVIKPTVPVARNPHPAVSDVTAALTAQPPAISAPASVASGPELSFQDRFAAAAPQGVESAVHAEAPKFADATGPKNVAPSPPPVQLAAVTPAPRAAEPRPARTVGNSVRDMAQRAKAAVMSIASNERQTIVEKLWGKLQAEPHGSSLLSFASADASITGSLGPATNPALAGNTPRYDQSTAVYDISAHTVYLPDGTKLEAHSGLGSKFDDPSSANVRMRGVTPPHLYELTQREALFHGVAALRLNPVGGEEAIYGRSGLLAHTYMLGSRGESNGCVSFKDYNAFLNAYRNQGIKRLAVVASID
jgi:hypothetical protein